MLKLGAVAIVFYTLSTVTSSALQAVDKVKSPMYHSFISLVVHIVLVVVLLFTTDLGIYALVIGNASFPVIIFILNLITLYREEGYRLPVMKIFMGVFTILSYNMMYNATSSNAISVIVALVVALVTYFGLYGIILKKFRGVL